MKEAMAIIDAKEKGFRVAFEKVGGGVLRSDYFPDKDAGEDLIKTEEEAWELAKRFANAVSPKEYVNIYVVDNKSYPVSGYERKKLHEYRVSS